MAQRQLQIGRLIMDTGMELRTMGLRWRAALRSAMAWGGVHAILVHQQQQGAARLKKQLQQSGRAAA